MLRESHSHMAQIGRALGMARTLRRQLRPHRGEPFSVLDVGTGGGAILRDLVAWGGPRWSGIGVDLHEDVIRTLADTPGAARVRYLQGNALELPLADRSVDATISNLMIHHLTESQILALLEELARVTRGLVLLNDLERHPVTAAGAHVLSKTLWARNPLTRADGPLSVRRSFTRNELQTLLDTSPLPGISVRRRFPFRLVVRMEIR